MRHFVNPRSRPRPILETPWADRELEAARRFVSGHLDARQFTRDLLHARHESIAADEYKVADFENLLNDLWFAIDTHNDYDELREPDEFDDGQLRDVVTGYLAGWDAGTWAPDPRWAG
jgi:hypothetical protein